MRTTNDMPVFQANLRSSSLRRVSMPFVKGLRRHLERAYLPKLGWSARGPATFLLGYIIPVSHETHDAMRRLQVRLLNEFGTRLRLETNPHITLKQAFPIAAFEPFERHLDRIVQAMDPFDVHVRNIGCFDEGIIFFDVLRTDALSALRRRIVSDLANDFGVVPEPLEDERYHFHATVAHGLPPHHLETARHMARREPLEFHFTCDTLGLLLHTGREWITYKHSTIRQSS